MILAFDTSSAACTAALFDDSGVCLAHADEIIGRGHAERLVPMIAGLIDGQVPDEIVVGVGPGSFTGIRVAIAAARGMAIGWAANVRGMSSLALLAASAPRGREVAVAIQGGHGELFVQEFDVSLCERSSILNLPAGQAAAEIAANLVVGSGARELVAARGWGEAIEGWPSARSLFQLPCELRILAARPVYVRAPDARRPEAA